MQQQKKVSYIRKPFARRSFMCLGLALAALVLAVIGVASSVMTAGNAELNVAAVCFCSLLIALVSLLYGALSFLEREKKYILSKIGMAVSGLLILIWVVLIIIGFGG